MRRYSFLGVVILYLVINSLLARTNRPRVVESINLTWRFQKGEVQNGFSKSIDDAQWLSVDLPHTWNVDDSFDQRGIDDGLDITYYYYRGPGWYRKRISLADHANSRLVLFFEGANAVTDLWVNEHYVGQHVGGYTGFQFDITPYLQSGENLIAVRVDNSYNYDIPPIRADYTMYGGIYRDVFLIKTTDVYIQIIQISTPKVNAELAMVELRIPIVNLTSTPFKGQLEFNIVNPQNQVGDVQKIKVTLDPGESIDKIFYKKILKPQLWSPETPHLYRVVVRLITNEKIIDELSDHFGCRWFSFDPDRGFFLNGKQLRLKGVNRHQDRAGFGNALPNKLHIEDMQLIKSVGANFVRLAHYPQDPAVLNACDSLGLLVWEEIPVVTTVGKEKFKANSIQMLQEMITQHYNHPSIIIWGLMNETIRHQPDDQLHWAVDLCEELNSLAKRLDPCRFTAQAQFDSRGTDILEVTDIRGWNRYFGWYSHGFNDFGKFMDEQKRLHPHHVFIISEYGAGSKRGYHIANSVEPDFSENWQLAFHQSYWKQICDRPWIAGSCVWNMFDFASDEKGGNIPHINQKGLADFDRIPKDVFYFYQSVWTNEPMIYIVSHIWLERIGAPGEIQKVEVLSNCQEVELFLNKISLGQKKAPFLWNVLFQEGRNEIRARGTTGKKEVEDKLSLKYKIRSTDE